jgi:hypothetical protein
MLDNQLVGKMQRRDLKSMSADHEELVAELSRKIAAEKNRLDERLHKLGPADDRLKHERRPYPRCSPNIEIRRTLRRPGLAVANNLAG